MEIRVLARGVALVGVEARDPHVLEGEAGALAEDRVLLHVGQAVLARHEAVADRCADRVRALVVDDDPPARRERVDQLRRLRLAAQQRAHAGERRADRIAGPGRRGLRVHLVDGVALAVEIEVEPRVEEVLVVHRVEALGDERSVGRLLARLDGARRDDPGELDLELDRAVEVEHPVEAVVVIADRRDEADHETARAPHLGVAGAEVPVLPEQPGVLLVQADRIGERDGLAGSVAHDGVEVVDQPEAVAAERERVGERADQVLADVERALDEARRARIAVRHRHLADRGAMQDRALLVALSVGELVQDEAFPHRPAGAERPALPADQVAVDREAGALRLHDLDRAHVGALRPGQAGAILADLGRDGHDAVVVDADDLAPVQVDERDDALDRPSVRIALGRWPHPDEPAADPAGPRSSAGTSVPAGIGSTQTSD